MEKLLKNMKMFRPIAALFLITYSTVWQPAIANDKVAPPIREFDLDIIERLGRAMYDQDRIAAIATDALFDFVGEPDKLMEQGVKGWVVQQQLAGARVRFIKESTGNVTAAYDIWLANGKAPEVSMPQDTHLTAEQTALFKARQLAVQNIPKYCSQAYNTIILPDPEKPGWLVYALAASTDSDIVPVGGHYRFSVSEDGNKLLQVDSLSATCLTLSRHPASLPAGKPVLAFYMSHVVSDTPVETHVFLNLQSKVPFVVTTTVNSVWKIEDGRFYP